MRWGMTSPEKHPENKNEETTWNYAQSAFASLATRVAVAASRPCEKETKSLDEDF
jgi:hypothetical protein